jgi:FKBP-type peptidyl-prolyl cis-trans isomerase
MSIRWVMAIGIGLLTGTAAAQDASALKTQKEKLSYALGMDLANQLKAQNLDLDPTLFMDGFRAMISGSKTLLTVDEAKAALNVYQSELVQKQADATKALAEKNKKDGEAFLAANKAKEGVVTLESGLQYKILKAGDGNKPKEDDTVVCNYRGTSIDGTEFDSSYKRNQPATFPVKGVIKGWIEALQLMPAGSKWQLFVPGNLAYGENGRPPIIGPNATLVFEVELISVEIKK